MVYSFFIHNFVELKKNKLMAIMEREQVSNDLMYSYWVLKSWNGSYLQEMPESLELDETNFENASRYNDKSRAESLVKEIADDKEHPDYIYTPITICLGRNEYIKNYISGELLAIDAISELINLIGSAAINQTLISAREFVNGSETSSTYSELLEILNIMYEEKFSIRHSPFYMDNVLEQHKFWVYEAVIHLCNVLIAPDESITYHFGRTEQMVILAKEN